MPRTIRKNLLNWAQAAIEHLDACDYILMKMNEAQAGRQPAIPEDTPLLLEAHEQVRAAWRLLKSRL